MIVEFLRYGYIGLLALLLFLCYLIIEGENSKGRAFSQTLILVGVFSTISLIGGVAGYFWASKELEITQKKESVLTIKNQQISITRQHFETSIQSLQVALDKAVASLNESVLDSTRQTKLKEIVQITEIIQHREAAYTNELQEITKVFGSENE
jgi:hypothetical protein